MTQQHSLTQGNEAMKNEITSWNIQYANDTYAALQVSGTKEHAEKIANKRNKYGESFVITRAPKEDNSIALEQSAAEAMKYGNTDAASTILNYINR